MTEKERLKIYDTLREFHKNKLLRTMHNPKLSNWEKNALEAIACVLYLAEGVFGSEESTIRVPKKKITDKSDRFDAPDYEVPIEAEAHNEGVNKTIDKITE